MRWMVGCVAVVVWMVAVALPAVAEEGAEMVGPAPDGCWPMRDGGPARTGCARTAGVREPVEMAWSVALGDAASVIDDEPRVWHDRVYVTLGNGKGNRELHVLALLDGTPLVKPKEFSAQAPLDISVWHDIVLVRESKTVLGAYRIKGDGLVSVWRQENASGFYSPMLVGRSVYALAGGTVTCWELGQEYPRWRKHGVYRGRLAIRGDTLYALHSDKVGNTSLAPFDRHAGTAGALVRVGSFVRRGLPAEGEHVHIAALEGDVFVHRRQGYLTADKTNSATTSCLVRRGLSYSGDGLHTFDRPPVEAGAGWLTTHDNDKLGHCLAIWSRDPQDNKVKRGILASGNEQRNLHETGLPLTVAGGMTYAGASGFEHDSRRLHWMEARRLNCRPVPAHRTLLLVEGRRHLTARRTPGEQGQLGTFFKLAPVASGAAGGPERAAMSGTVFFVDEEAHEGAFVLDEAKATLTTIKRRGKREKRTSHPITRVTFVLDGEHRLLYAASTPGLPAALRRWGFLRRTDGYAKLARDAVKTNDAAFLRSMISAARARGVPEKKLRMPLKRLEKIVDNDWKPKPKVRDKLVARIKAWDEEHAAILLQVLASPLEDTRWPIQRACIRRLLAGGAQHGKAAALVRERLPAYVTPPEPFDALAWIDLVDQLQHRPAKRLRRPKSEREELTRPEREYGAALASWRDDLLALESGELLVLTPLARPGRIAGCLALGRLVCDALSELFNSGTHVRKNTWPLILRLYETKEAYLKATLRGRVSDTDRIVMEESAGHFDSGAGISRIYMPEARASWDRIMKVYAHELTHHWIEERCPLFRVGDRRRTGVLPGHWIVEGFAEFVEGFRWNVAQQTWSAKNPQARSLDLVARATPKQLIPWRDVFNMTHAKFQLLDRREVEFRVPMRWRLGYSNIMSEGGMYYAQAAAACHYFYFAGAKERAALFEYVRAYYTGQLPKKLDTIQRFFGLPAGELGARIVAHAKKETDIRHGPD